MVVAHLLAFTAAVAGGTSSQSATGAQPGQTMTEISKADAETLKAKCGVRKVEAVIQVLREGAPRRSKFTLCAPESDTDAQWLATLEKAVPAIEANPTIVPASKTALLLNVQQEIARLKGLASTKAAPPGAVAATPTPAPMAQLPIAPPLAPVVGPPPKPGDIPAYVPPAGAINRFAFAARCVAPGSGRSQPCEEMAPNERLEIRAEADVESPVSLLFRQTGRGLLGDSSKEAEVELASDGMRRGETVLMRVPKKICSGFRSRFEVEVRTKDQKPNQRPYVLGPFEMRCDS